MFDPRAVIGALVRNLEMIRRTIEGETVSGGIEADVAATLDQALAELFNELITVLDMAARELARTRELQLQVADLRGRLGAWARN
jgi:hypothetical protein